VLNNVAISFNLTFHQAAQVLVAAAFTQFYTLILRLQNMIHSPVSAKPFNTIKFPSFPSKSFLSCQNPYPHSQSLPRTFCHLSHLSPFLRTPVNIIQTATLSPDVQISYQAIPTLHKSSVPPLLVANCIRPVYNLVPPCCCLCTLNKTSNKIK